MTLRRLGIPALAVALGLAGCGLFEFSPYETRLEDGQRGLAALNIAKLAASPPTDSPFTFAVLSDIQGAYDELESAVRLINADTSIRLVIVPGDLTQSGMRKEFQWVERGLSRLAAPYLTAFGNHDALANGTAIYKDMFGPVDFSFVHRGMKFVFYNDNSWHYDCCVPDFDWLESRFREAGDSLDIIAVSHIPPYGDQLDSAASLALVELLSKYGARLSIHGHPHSFRFGKIHGGDVEYLIADDIGDRNYAKVVLREGGITVERVFF